MSILALAIAGLWVERRRWLACLAMISVVVLAAYFAYPERYPYGAYKIVSVNLWIVAFFAIAGGGWLLRSATLKIQPITQSKFSTATIVSAFLLTGALSHRIFAQSLENGELQEGFREATTIAKIVGNQPTLISVREDLANQWAVLYLSEGTAMVSPLRMYMAQSHVVPLMQRSKPVDPSTIGFIVTDSGPDRVTVENARIISLGRIYSLWKVDNENWSVSATGGAHNDHISIKGKMD